LKYGPLLELNTSQTSYTTLWVQKALSKCALSWCPWHTLQGSCWGKGMELELIDKTWARKKNSSYKFSKSLVRKHLNRIHISLCPVTPPQGGKMKHHWGSKKNKCQATTLYGSCDNLSNEKWNASYTSRCKVVGMWLYKRGWQRAKWKDPKTSNVETQVQVDANGMGVKESIRLGWWQGFGLDELYV
jgi:hypothetical protein